MAETVRNPELNQNERSDDVFVFPAGPAQQQLWFVNQMAPESPAYNIPFAYRVRGRLDVASLHQSLCDIVRRHEVFRTTFALENGQLVQIVSPDVEVTFPVVDINSDSSPVQSEDLQGAIEKESRRTFNLQRGPLFRFSLLRLGESDHVLLLNFHHIILDHTGILLFARELSANYKAHLSGVSLPRSDANLQYADFVVWQQEEEQQRRLHEKLEYWRNQLSGEPPLLGLPTDRIRPARPTFQGKEMKLRLPADLSEQLRDFARREKKSLFVVTLAAFKALLHKYGRQDEITIGCPFANRLESGLEEVVGCLVNTFPLRTRIESQHSFRDILDNVRQTVLDASAHQEVPIGWIVEHVQQERSSRYGSLFQTSFVFQEPPMDLELCGVETESYQIHNGSAKFDLSVWLWDEGPEIAGLLEYSTDLYDEATIQRFAAGYIRLLEQVVSQPQAKHSELDLLTKPESQRLLCDWAAAPVDYPRDHSIVELFEHQVTLTPESVALIEGNRRLSYRELNERANCLARHLQERGVKRNSLVPLFSERSIDLVVGMLGVLKANAAYVPLDAELPQQRIDMLLETLDAKVVLAKRSIARTFPSSSQLVDLDQLEDLVSTKAVDNLDEKPQPEDLAYVNFTSGTTGVPQGVEIVHRGVVRLICSQEYVKLDGQQVLVHLSTPSFDATTFEVWGGLLTGARVVLFQESASNTGLLEEALTRHSVTTAFLTTSLFNAIVDERPQALAGVKQLLVGGEAMSVEHARRALDLLPDLELSNIYGPTESTTFACCYRVPRDLPDECKSIPIGRPISNTKTYVLDQHLKPVPVGMPGELFIGGDGLAKGYLNMPELTKRRFIRTDIGGQRERLFRTGDRVRWLPNGNLEFLGRLDSQVKLRGFRIEPGEIEIALSRHPDVADAVVTLQETSLGDKQLVAYVTERSTNALAKESIREFLKDSLPSFMIPTGFVVLPQIPITAQGKTDYRKLPKLPRAKQLDGSLPTTEIERKLAEIWSAMLKVKEVRVDEDFFELGGHSLLATRMIARVEKELDSRIPLTMLYKAPTIAGFAELVQNKTELNSASSIAEIQTGGVKPPVYFLHDLAGHAAYCTQLVKYMGSDQPILTINLSTDDRFEQFDSIEAIAQTHMRQLVEANPDGPYRLVGYSFGGLLAFELAKQLEQQGRIVDRLIIIDTGRSRQTGSWITRFTRGTWLFVRNLPVWCYEQIAAGDPVEFRKDVKRTLRSLFSHINFLRRSKEVALESALNIGEIDEQLRCIMQRHLNAAFQYDPDGLKSRVTLIRSRAPTYRAYSHDLGWQGRTQGGVDVRVIPGTHVTILKEPRIAKLGEEIQRVLDGCQTDNTTSKSGI